MEVASWTLGSSANLTVLLSCGLPHLLNAVGYVTLMPVENDCLEEAAESLDGVSQQHCHLGEDVCAQIESLIVSTCLNLPRNSIIV